MKKKFLLFYIVLIINISSAYSQTNKVTYQRTSPNHVDIALLYYNDTLSFFNYDKFLKGEKQIEKQTLTEDGNKDIIISSDTLGTYQYINTSTEKLYERRSGEKFIIIEEEFTPLDWQLIDSTQKVGNYICQLASTFCYGRTFYAWYTSEIPSDKAPWKLGGLPGLVLYAYDSDQKCSWKATNIEFDIEFNFTPYFLNLKTNKTMTLAHYFKEKDEDAKKMIRSIESMLAQTGTTGEVRYELDRNDIEKEAER